MSASQQKSRSITPAGMWLIGFIVLLIFLFLIKAVELIIAFLIIALVFLFHNYCKVQGELMDIKENTVEHNKESHS